MAYQVFPAEVLASRWLSPHLVRVTLTSNELEDFRFAGRDQRVKLIFPGPEGLPTFDTNGDWHAQWRSLDLPTRGWMRTYTARGFREETLELDIDFAVHGDHGPASRWARRAAPGQRLLVVAPSTAHVPAVQLRGTGVEWAPHDQASRLVVVGDETAVPAVASILEHHRGAQEVQAFLEVECSDDILPLEDGPHRYGFHAPARRTVHWLPRQAMSAPFGREEGAAVPHGQLAVSALRRAVPDFFQEQQGRGEVVEDHGDELLWEVPDGGGSSSPFYWWIAGESGFVRELRRFLVSEMGVDRRTVAFMGYWKQGQPGG